MPIEALSEADLDRLKQSKIPDETKKLDSRRPQMSQEIHSCVGPFWGPRNERKNIFARLSDVYVLNAVASRPTSIDFRRRPVTFRKCDKTRENCSKGGILTSSDVQGGSWAAR